MEALELEAQIRDNAGKGYAKRLRQDGLLPCVFYGAEVDGSIPITVKVNELEKIVKDAGANALIKLKVDGREYITLVRELQVHPVKRDLLHADLYQISMKEKLQTTVGLYISGEAPGVKEGGVLQQFLREVEVECLPINIPDHIVVDVSGLGFGESVSVSDLVVGDDVEILTDPETTVVSVVAAQAVEEPEEAEDVEAEEGAEEAEAAEEPQEGDE